MKAAVLIRTRQATSYVPFVKPGVFSTDFGGSAM
jgi:hypothetical protein